MLLKNGKVLNKLKKVYNKNIFFSIVVPTFNSKKYIYETLESIDAQTYTNFEVIISDDGSIDETVKIIQTFFKINLNLNYKIILNKHLGPGNARNQGIKKSSGDWIAFLDSDDIWDEKKLEICSLKINENINYNFIPSSIIHMDKIGKIVDPSIFIKSNNLFHSLYRQNSLSTSAVIIKKRLLMETDLFNCNLLSAQDYDLWLKIALLENCNIGFIKQPLTTYRTSNSNISSNIKRRLDCMLQIGFKYKKNLAQKTKFSFYEFLIFKSNAYLRASIGYYKKKNFLLSAYYLIRCFFSFPLRFDLILKILKK